MKNITMNERDLRLLLTDAIRVGVNQTLVELGQLKPYLSKAEAYRMYGRKQVNRWIKEKIVEEIKDGTNTSKFRLSRVELEKVAMTSNRMSWYSHYVPEED